LIVTPYFWSSANSWLLFANDGICVEKRVVGWAVLLVAGYVIALLSVPWIESPVDEIEVTWCCVTCFRKVG